MGRLPYLSQAVVCWPCLRCFVSSKAAFGSTVTWEVIICRHPVPPWGMQQDLVSVREAGRLLGTQVFC